MVHVKWIVSVVSSIVIVVVGLISFLGIKSINDISTQVSKDVKVSIKHELSRDQNNIESINQLFKSLRNAQADYKTNRKAIDALSVLKMLPTDSKNDPHFAYSRLTKLEDAKSTVENRGAAKVLLDDIIRSGESGIAEPNTLFNASVVAARLEFQLEAVKLATLAEHWHPSISHKAMKAERDHKLGKQFQLIEKQLQPVSGKLHEIRRSAWISLLDLVRSSPRLRSEQVYSRAGNVARSFGYYKQLIEAIVFSEQKTPAQLTSYAYATLATAYIQQGNADWKVNYWAAVRKAIRKLKGESRGASWYAHTVQDITKTAMRVDEIQKLKKIADEEGFSVGIWN